MTHSVTPPYVQIYSSFYFGMKHGYVKVAAGVPFVEVANCFYNIERIEALVRKAAAQKVELLTFPELSITGYTCGDLFLQPFLIEQAEKAVELLAERTKDIDMLYFVGMPLEVEDKLFNTAVAIQKGKIIGAIPKTYLPNYREFQEKRWFSSSYDLLLSTARIGKHEFPIGHDVIFLNGEIGIGVEICEDMWSPLTPGTRLALYGAHIIFNLSASNESAGKNAYLKSLVSGLSAQQISAYVYTSCGIGESSTDNIYTGKAFIAENGVILGEMPRFEISERLLISDIDVSRIRAERLINSTFRKAASVHTSDKLLVVPFEMKETEDYDMTRHIDRDPFMPAHLDRKERSLEMFHIQVTGLIQRLRHLGSSKVVIGVSGGLDSTLALLVAVKAMTVLGRSPKEVIAVTMPGLGTSNRTKGNAEKLMELLGVDGRTIPIGAMAETQLRAIGHDAVTEDTTYENTQARTRTEILMNLANLEGGFVLGTGDLSEVSLGWSTFNGDHMSMYNVNGSVTKTSIRTIVTELSDEYSEEIKEVLLDVVATPVSPELKNDTADVISQETEKILGPYEVHDFFIFHMLQNAYSPEKLFFLAEKAFEGKYAPEEIKGWLKTFLSRFFASQYKRNAMPDGPKVATVSLSPRGTWLMPSDAGADMWLKAIDNL